MDDVLAAADIVGLKAIGRKLETGGGHAAHGEPQKGPDLLSDWEIATLDFRFAVGDIVQCSVHGRNDGYQDGTVIQ